MATALRQAVNYQMRPSGPKSALATLRFAKPWVIVIVSLLTANCASYSRRSGGTAECETGFSGLDRVVFDPIFASESQVTVELSEPVSRDRIRDSVYLLDSRLHWHGAVCVGQDLARVCDSEKFCVGYRNLDRIPSDSVLVYSIVPFRTGGFAYRRSSGLGCGQRAALLPKILTSEVRAVFELDSNSIYYCNARPDTTITRYVFKRDTLYTYTISCVAWGDGYPVGNMLFSLVRPEGDSAHVIYTCVKDGSHAANDYLGVAWIADLYGDGAIEMGYLRSKGDESARYVGKVENGGIEELFLSNKMSENCAKEFPCDTDSLFVIPK